MSEQVVRLVMPAKSEYLILARLALAGIARQTPISEDVLADLKLAVTEACGNAVRHAYADATGVVEVRFVVAPESIEIEVRDDGEPRARTRRRPSRPTACRPRAAWGSRSSRRSSTTSTSSLAATASAAPSCG